MDDRVADVGDFAEPEPEFEPEPESAEEVEDSPQTEEDDAVVEEIPLKSAATAAPAATSAPAVLPDAGEEPEVVDAINQSTIRLAIGLLLAAMGLAGIIVYVRKMVKWR